MARITKTPEERRLEIVQTAERLFREVGFTKCSVDMIIRDIGVSKGTFYYYFKSKEEILEAIVDRTLVQIVEMAEQVADAPSLDALTKMQMLLSDSHIGDDDTHDIAEMLHMPENRELHEITNIQSVMRLSPILAKIVEQGNLEGVFSAGQPLETVQFLLTGSQFLLDGRLFAFSEQEVHDRRVVAQQIIEKSLGAKPGSFDFMNPNPMEGK
ncbi:MAG: TetR/AcrR family transcriptional regulator [Rhodobacteraceae bacterium]|nr:TetR/AcrR family transcriptional regulator [Paracoccaceae bacterium]